MSKALLKSRRIRSVCFPDCILLDSSSTSIMSCVSQDLFSRNPCCSSEGMFCSVKCLEIPEATTCSSIYRGHRSGILADNWLVRIVPIFKDRGYIGLFPDRCESPCIKGSLEDQF